MTYAKSRWTALADPTRHSIFELLVDHPRSVGDLDSFLPVSRPAVSHHLKVLKGAGLVLDLQAGKQRIYRADLEGLAALRAELDLYWSKTLDTYKSLIEQTPEETR